MTELEFVTGLSFPRDEFERLFQAFHDALPTQGEASQ